MEIGGGVLGGRGGGGGGLRLGEWWTWGCLESSKEKGRDKAGGYSLFEFRSYVF